ncbi:MAG: insulinase family protein [Pseudomonadota bacterium]
MSTAPIRPVPAPAHGTPALPGLGAAVLLSLALATNALGAEAVNGAVIPAPRAAPGSQARLVRVLEGVAEYSLENGLQVLLVPDATRLITTVHLTLHTGAASDSPGESGAMHLLEHLMFRTRPGRQPSRGEIAQRGIRANATTTYDRTTFFASFAADTATQRWYLNWLADAFEDGTIEPGQLAAEWAAIRNETQVSQSAALTVASNAANAALYGPQGYGRPPIGRAAEIERLDAHRLTAIRAQYYRPDNATLIVAGAIDPTRTLREIEQAFGKRTSPPRTPVPKPVPAGTSTPSATSESTLSVAIERAGVGPLLVAAAPGPSARHADAPAAKLLVFALTREPSGPLHHRLVGNGVASRVLGQARVLSNEGALLFALQPAPGATLAAAQQALQSALSELEMMPAEQVERARHGWMAEWRRRYNDPERLAEDLSEAVGRGDWRLHFADYQRMRSLDAAELHRVASRWLTARPPLFVTLQPTALSSAAPSPAAFSLEPLLAGLQGTNEAPKVASDALANGLDFQALELVRGRVTLSVARHRLRGQAIHARLAIPVLGAASSQVQTRSAGLMAAMLGAFDTAPGGPEAFQFGLDKIETSLSVGFFRQELFIDLQTTRAHFDEAMERVRQLLGSGPLDEAALARQKRQWSGRVERAMQDPSVRLDELLSRHGNTHLNTDVRYVPTLEEELASLRDVRLPDVERVRDALRPLRGLRLAVVGDMDTASVAKSLERHLLPLLAVRRSDVAPTLVDDERKPPPPAALVSPMQGTDVAVLGWAAFLPLRESSRDALALSLGNRIFGQPGSGRLWRRLRERDALSYGAWSQLDWNPFSASSWWRASVTFAAQDIARVQRALEEELEAVERNGFTPEELALAKIGFVNERRLLAFQPSWLLRRQLDSGRSDTPVKSERHIEQDIADMHLDDVNRAWRHYIRAQALVRGVVGNLPREP